MLSRAQKNKQKRLKKEEKERKNKLVKKIDRKKIEIQVKADENGTMYAGIDKKSLSAELNKQGFDVAPSEIKMKGVIKKIGKHKVELKILGQKASLVIETKKD